MENSELGIVEKTPCFQWRIPDFYSLKKRCVSPPFSCLGCTWYLELDYNYAHDSDDSDSEEDEADVMLNLYVKDFGALDKKSVIYALGVKKNSGELEERKPKLCNFTKDMTWGSSTMWEVKNMRERKSELALYDAVVFFCRMENSNAVEAVPRLVGLVGLEALSADFKGLLANKKKCDVTIKVKDKEFQAHRAVLVARCSVFSAMFEHGMTEEETGVVTVPDCDPESFGVFLHYLYTGKIEDVSFRNVYHLYVTADKYDVQVLKSFCRSYMMENLTAGNICDVVTLAERFDDVTLMSAAQTFFNHNVAEIISKSEWEAMMKNSYRLANTLLKEMTSKVKILC